MVLENKPPPGSCNSWLAHLEDLADKALKQGAAASRFLTPAESRSAAEYFKYKRIAVLCDGGFDNAERSRAVFLNPDWGTYDRAGYLAALKIRHRPQDQLTHRDVLGALMALGIERDTVGDIVCGEGDAYLVCLPELGGYITDNLTQAGRVGLTVSVVDLDELPGKPDEQIIKTVNVASLRLDAVLGAGFGLSRSKAAELITAGRVNVDYQLCLQPAKVLQEGTMLSVRGTGRAKVLEIAGVSKKGRLFVRLGFPAD